MLSTLDLIINFIESFLTILFVQLCMKSTNKYRYVYMAIATLIIFSFVTIFNIFNLVGVKELLLDVLCTIITFLLAMLLSKNKSIVNCTFLAILSSLILHISAILILVCIEFYTLIFSDNSINYPLFLIVSKIFFAILIFIFSKFISIDFESKSYYLGYANISMLLLIFLNNIMLDLSLHHRDMKLAGYASLAILSLLAFFIYLMFKKSSQDQADKLKYKFISSIYKAKEENYYQFEASAKEISKLKHDMKHILLSIKEHNKNSDYEEINKVIDSYLSVINNVKQLINTGNISLDYIISQNIKLMKDNNIEFVCNYCNVNLPVDQTDFYIIAGNLIENAIENCKSDCIKKISVFTGVEKNKYYLKIVNTINNSVLTKNPYLYTTKTDKINHGLGIQSVKLLVDKYNGAIELYEEQDLFSVIVLFPL